MFLGFLVSLLSPFSPPPSPRRRTSSISTQYMMAKFFTFSETLARVCRDGGRGGEGVEGESETREEGYFGSFLLEGAEIDHQLFFVFRVGGRWFAHLVHSHARLVAIPSET